MTYEKKTAAYNEFIQINGDTVDIDLSSVIDLALARGRHEGQESAFRKVIEALNSEPAKSMMDDFSVYWAAWLQENKEKILQSS